MDFTSTIFGSALMAVILLSCPFTAPQETGVPPAPSPPIVLNSSNESLNIPPDINTSPPANYSPPSQSEQDWAMINKSNVEGACLSQAKKAAVAGGYSEGLVFSCACGAQESAGIKSYECSVSALDGAHPISINCTKSEKNCRITFDGSIAAFTFDQLQALANP